MRADPGRYLRTLRHLHWRQWVFRPLRLVQRLAPPARVQAHADPARLAPLAAALLATGPGDAAARLRRAEEACAGRFVFLGQELLLRRVDWRRRYLSPLWSFHLHYFDYAADLAWAYRLTGQERFVRRLEELATGWIEATAGGGGDAWHPYPVSVRVQNWVRALLLAGDGLRPAARETLTASLAAQLGLLERRLEWQVLANHLLKNLCALLLGGACFAGAAAERWRSRGLRRLGAQLREQVLADGTHCERAPMYHAMAFADLLEVLLLLGASGQAVPPDVSARTASMAAALGRLSRPDGTLHLLNDSAQEQAPPLAWIDALSRRLLGSAVAAAEGAWRLPHGGFAGYADPTAGERLVVDCGGPGPAYQPAHAHCGAMGFELDLLHRPVVVDSGVCGYEGDRYREYVRSTRAHSTVMIGGREQSEVWGTFRVGGRAEVPFVHLEPGGTPRLEAGCRPWYDRRVLHRRSFTRQAGGWRVSDRVEGAPGAPLQSFLHLHPDAEVERAGPALRARFAEGVVEVAIHGADEIVLHQGAENPLQGWWCPAFGRALPAPVLELRVGANDGREFGYSLTARPA